MTDRLEKRPNLRCVCGFTDLPSRRCLGCNNFPNGKCKASNIYGRCHLPIGHKGLHEVKVNDRLTRAS